MKATRLNYLALALGFVSLLATGCGSTEGKSLAGARDSFAPAAGAGIPERTPDPAPEPVLQPLRIPQNTAIRVRLLHAISSRSASAGGSFEAEIAQGVKSGNSIAIHRGSRVRGRIVSAKPSGRLHNPGVLRLTLSEVQGINGRWIPITTSFVSARGTGHARRNLALIGGGSGAGAVIGALAGGGKGAAIGAASGAAAGTAGAYATGRKDVEFGAEHELTFRTVREVVITRGEKGSGTSEGR
jgi:hypothetical protein